MLLYYSALLRNLIQEVDDSRYTVVLMYSTSLELLSLKNVRYMFELGLLLVFSFIDYLFILGVILYTSVYSCIHYFTKLA